MWSRSHPRARRPQPGEDARRVARLDGAAQVGGHPVGRAVDVEHGTGHGRPHRRRSRRIGSEERDRGVGAQLVARARLVGGVEGVGGRVEAGHDPGPVGVGEVHAQPRHAVAIQVETHPSPLRRAPVPHREGLDGEPLDDRAQPRGEARRGERGDRAGLAVELVPALRDDIPGPVGDEPRVGRRHPALAEQRPYPRRRALKRLALAAERGDGALGHADARREVGDGRLLRVAHAIGGRQHPELRGVEECRRVASRLAHDRDDRRDLRRGQAGDRRCRDLGLGEPERDAHGCLRGVKQPDLRGSTPAGTTDTHE